MGRKPIVEFDDFWLLEEFEDFAIPPLDPPLPLDFELKEKKINCGPSVVCGPSVACGPSVVSRPSSVTCGPSVVY